MGLAALPRSGDVAVTAADAWKIRRVLLTVMGCAGGAADVGGDHPALSSISVAVAPANLVMAAGVPAVFTATVTGAADASVSWSVQEGAAGGSIDGSGHYTAPGTAGTYHVVATSVADPSKKATATVTVTPSISVSINPPSASSKRRSAPAPLSAGPSRCQRRSIVFASNDRRTTTRSRASTSRCARISA